MSNTERKTNFRQGWWVRNAVYVVVAVAGLVITGLGFATQEQVDAFTASPLLATIVGGLASMFTGPGSGPAEDAEAAEERIKRTAQETAAAAARDAAELVVNKINSYGRHAAPAKERGGSYPGGEA